MEIHEIQNGLRDILVTVDKVYGDYSIAKANYENLEEKKKPYLALIAQVKEGKSATERERKALASEEYRKFITGLNQARAEYIKTWSEVKSLDVKLACYQSLNKTLTKELEINTNVL